MRNRGLPRARRFAAETEVGPAHVDVVSALRESPFRLGEATQSGFAFPAAGRTGVEFFTKHKAE